MVSVGLSPAGLFFAAILAALLALGEVCNKKLVQDQKVVVAVFWIRLFAVLEITAVLLVFAWRGSPPVIHPAAALTQGDIQNIPALAEQLRNPASPAVQRIADRLSPTTRTQLATYRKGTDDTELANSLRADFNGAQILDEAALFHGNDLTGIPLSVETRNVLDQKPSGEMRVYANRLLLEDLFRASIARSRRSPLFGLNSVMVAPRVAFSVYLLIEIVLVAASQFLTSLALKVSPISLCIPFTTFTPIFLVATGYMVLRELPTAIEMLGISLIVLGGLLMNRNSFAVDWKGPFKAIVKERGIRYILFATFIASIFGPIEKQMILMSDPLTTAFGYGVGTVIAFGAICKVLRVDLKQVIRQKPGWAVLAGLSDANTMFAQFFAVMYLPVVVVISIKRAGIVLTIVAGWLIFREKDITNRLIAAVAMMGGIAIFYLPLQFSQAIALTGLVVAALAVALYLTRNTAREAALTGESAEGPAAT